MTNEKSPYAKRRTRLEKIFNNFEKWRSFIEGGQVSDTLSIDGEDWNFYDLQKAIEVLPTRQRQSFDLTVLQDLTDKEAAKRMGFIKWSTPVQQYRNLALTRILSEIDKYKEQEDRDRF